MPAVVLREGQLLWRNGTGAMSKWKQKFFVLTNRSMDRFGSRDDYTSGAAPAATLPLIPELNSFELAAAGVRPPKVGACAFTIAVGTSKWQLAAESEAEMMLWQGALTTQSAAPLQIFVGSWNVGNAQPPSDMSAWIPKNGQGGFYDIIAVGAQESSYVIVRKSRT